MQLTETTGKSAVATPDGKSRKKKKKYTDISDHLPVFTISECTQKRHGKGSRIINMRSFSGQNVCLFKYLVGSIDCAPVLSQIDIQQSYSIFVDLINTAYDEAFPIRRTFI